MFKRRKLSKNMIKFIEQLDEFERENMKKPWGERDICPPATDAQLVVDCLCDLILGEDWYVVTPIHTAQVNTVILDEILYKYCTEYRKRVDKKRRDKRRR